jgi:carboxypeptidase C (cathepsin A)
MSQSNVTNDPVIVHFNGGTAKPGCSSMMSYLLATGPYTFLDNKMNLSSNDYPLNLKASVFYIDSINTGFSV